MSAWWTAATMVMLATSEFEPLVGLIRNPYLTNFMWVIV
jgi:hypothetical protein